MLSEKTIFDRTTKKGFTPIALRIINGKRILEVKCKCGKIFNVSYKHIIGDHTKSCGCLQRRDLSGQRFGKLVVIKRIPPKKRSYRGTWYLCRCDCGNYKETISPSLIGKRTTSCGCIRFGKGSSQWTGYKCISGSFWASLRWSAKRRKLKLSITKKYAYNILEKQNFKCALSGVPIIIHSQGEKNTASLDRIDSSKGYIKGNIQWVHKQLNVMKWDISQSDFVKWCKLVIDNLNGGFDKLEMSDTIVSSETKKTATNISKSQN